MKTTAKFDVSAALSGLTTLDKVKYPLARSMAVAGGTILRDEAKARAPIGTHSENPGALADSIYLAFKDTRSTDTTIRYSVSWNAAKAPHGHLVEFGYWQPYVVFAGPSGWRTLATGDGRRGGSGVLRKDGPKWIPPKAFLRPAYDASLPRMQQAMVQRGRVRLGELMNSQPAASAP